MLNLSTQEFRADHQPLMDQYTQLRTKNLAGVHQEDPDVTSAYLNIAPNPGEAPFVWNNDDT